MKVGFAGAGSMAAAMARGWRRLGGPELMLFTDSGSGRAAALAEEVGGRRVASLGELEDAADVIVLAVKPAALHAAGGELERWRGPLISVLAATSLDAVAAAFPRAAVVRTLPNVAVEVGRGVICYTQPSRPEDLADSFRLLERLGTLLELPEGQLDAATAVMGCSPAYFALACEALIESGEEAGLEPETSRQLVSLTAAGTGELLTERDPQAIQRAVASPGGSTEAGLEALRAAGGPEAFRAAVRASLERMAGSQ